MCLPNVQSKYNVYTCGRAAVIIYICTYSVYVPRHVRRIRAVVEPAKPPKILIPPRASPYQSTPSAAVQGLIKQRHEIEDSRPSSCHYTGRMYSHAPFEYFCTGTSSQPISLPKSLTSTLNEVKSTFYLHLCNSALSTSSLQSCYVGTTGTTWYSSRKPAPIVTRLTGSPAQRRKSGCASPVSPALSIDLPLA